MTARRPIGYIPESALPRGRTPKHFEKTGKIRWHFIDTLKPRIEKFVRDSYFAGMETPEQRIRQARKDADSLMDFFASDEMQKEIAEDEDKDAKNFAEGLRNFGVMSGMKTDAEILKDLAEIDEELIGESVTSCADWIWQMAMNHCHNLWKSGGAQSVGIKEFLDGLDFFKILRGHIAEKYYPEIKGIIASLAPELFRESYTDTVRNTYMEVAYIESSGELVLREVSWEVVQTWADS